MVDRPHCLTCFRQMMGQHFRLPLFQLRIYAKDIFGHWIEIKFSVLNAARRFKTGVPEFSQASLSEIWDNHEATAGRAN